MNVSNGGLKSFEKKPIIYRKFVKYCALACGFSYSQDCAQEASGWHTPPGSRQDYRRRDTVMAPSGVDGFAPLRWTPELDRATLLGMQSEPNH